MLALLRTFSWQELRHHPWRSAAAVLAVMLGVALAFSVQLINQSALTEFESAVHSAGGQPDLELRGAQGRLDENLYAEIATHQQVALASPAIELSTFALDAQGERRTLRILGVDALIAAALTPNLVPVPAPGGDRFSVFAPATAFLNPSAQQAFGASGPLRVQDGLRLVPVHIAGSVSAGGAPLAVMDIGAVQDLFGRQGELTRLDVRLRPGVDRTSFLESLKLPSEVVIGEADDAAQRVGNLSRAYRVNLTVLALVALFTGAFLVYSVLALSVARRAQQFALLGVLGLTARQRGMLVMAESLALGALGSVLGIALGTVLADAGLRMLGGDLGGGYFQGVAPRLQWSTAAAAVYAALGCIAAGAGGWLPSHAAQHLPLAQTLKGLGSASAPSRWRQRLSLALIAAGAVLALVPPVRGIPLGAYLSVGLLLVGGIGALPGAVALVHDRLLPTSGRHPLTLLAIERARRVRESAAIAVSGVVASLSLAVALTVMVASFRDSVAHWLDVVLPADLYMRSAVSAATAETAWFSPELVQAVARLPGVRRVAAQRARALLFDPRLPAVSLLARDMDAPSSLPMIGAQATAPPGAIPIYVSEAVVDLYGARVGALFPPLAAALASPQFAPEFFVAGVWRDYVRQSGAIAIQRTDYERLTGDRRANDLQLWLVPGADAARVRQSILDLAQREGGVADAVEFASAQELREVSLRIFDRSFAVTYWLQAVAIVIGLFGVAASFSAQVLARRKEFGLLAHIGLTRAQILGVIAGEGATWTAIGSAAGITLGLAVAVVLVDVVNPQSFHWTMDLLVPWGRLLALCAAVIAAGTLTARLAGGAAASRDAVLAVKEDW